MYLNALQTRALRLNCKAVGDQLAPSQTLEIARERLGQALAQIRAIHVLWAVVNQRDEFGPDMVMMPSSVL